ncbi:MAG: hypothetical protein QXU79_01580 [Candidatus Micrarchaeaceae archaeon]
MSFLAYIPPQLLVADREREVILLLQALPIPIQNKKEILIEWCKYTGVALTKEMVDRILNPLLPGNVR